MIKLLSRRLSVNNPVHQCGRVTSPCGERVEWEKGSFEKANGARLKKNLSVYLIIQVFCSSARTLQLWNVGSAVVACGLSCLKACGILVP